MRTVGVLLILIALGQAEDLRPRTGSGWNGFKKGTWVRMKRTAVLPGKPPMITIWKQTLLKVDEKKLTLVTVSKNALGMEQTDRQEVPRLGEAGADEEQKVETLKPEAVFVAGKKLTAVPMRTTVTGKAGRRVVTTWLLGKPAMLVKRTVTQSDLAGKLVYSTTWLLSEPRAQRTINGKTIACMKYKTRMQHAGGREERGETYTSRAVPGGTVWVETETLEKGRVLLTQRIQLLEYKAK